MFNKLKNSVWKPFGCLLLPLLAAGYINNIGYKNPSQVSASLQEAKDLKVFIREWQIANVQAFDRAYAFPIEQAWEEKAWHLELNEKGKEVPAIDSLSSPNIVFLLKETSSFFSKDCLGKKWIMWSKQALGIGLTSGMLNTTLRSEYDDSTKVSFTIYRQKRESNMKEDIIPLFTFDLAR